MSPRKFGEVGHVMAIVGDLNVEVKSVAPYESASVRTAGNADGDAVCASCKEAVWCFMRGQLLRADDGWDYECKHSEEV